MGPASRSHLISLPARAVLVGPASAGKRPLRATKILGVANAVIPAKAGPTLFASAPDLNDRASCFSGTGFSREEALMSGDNFAVWRMPPSRLKPVLHLSSHPISPTARAVSVGPASAGKRPLRATKIFGVANAVFPAKAGPTFASAPDLNDRASCFSGTGFSREEALRCGDGFAV
jgi:hypothetical protein